MSKFLCLYYAATVLSLQCLQTEPNKRPSLDHLLVKSQQSALRDAPSQQQVEDAPLVDASYQGSYVLL